MPYAPLVRATFWLLVLLLALSVREVMSQSPESPSPPAYQELKKSVTLLNDTAQIDTLLAVGWQHAKAVNIEEAIKFAEWGLTKSEEVQYTSGRANAYLLLSSIATRLNQFDLMIEWTKKSEKLLEDGESLSIETIDKIYANLAAGYYQVGQYEASKKAYMKGVALARDMQDPKMEGSRYMGLGNIFYELDVYDSALFYYTKAEEAYSQYETGYAAAYIEASKANIYDAEGSFEYAKNSYRVALNAYRKNNNLFGVTWMFNNLASTLISLGELPQAQQYLDSARHYAEAHQYHAWKPYIIENEVKLYEKQGDYQSALAAQKKLQAFKDSLANTESVQQLSEIDAYDLEAKFESIRLRSRAAEKEADQQKMIAVLSVISGVTALLLLLILGFYYYKKQKYHAETQAQYEKTKLINSALEATQEELTQAHNVLSELNTNLEDKVKQRTEELESRNKLISEYAYINAHKMRASVARFIGLHSLFEMAEDLGEREYYIDLMSEVAHDLDGVTREISEILDEGFLDEISKK